VQPAIPSPCPRVGCVNGRRIVSLGGSPQRKGDTIVTQLVCGSGLPGMVGTTTNVEYPTAEGTPRVAIGEFVTNAIAIGQYELGVVAGAEDL
jgi:hypothetical protein